MITSKTAKKFF
jgi:hypothetical protein